MNKWELVDIQGHIKLRNRLRGTMKKITSKEMKSIELNILKDVAKFCDSNQLRYFLCGGTLLGAVRHHGFIPWDDDMDIAMPREDYKKFLMIYNREKSKYQVSAIENNQNWHMPFARVEDLNTILFEKTLKQKYRKLHVFIDVFPIDGIPDSPKIERNFMLKQKFLGIIVNASSFCFFPSRHYSDSKETHISLKNSVRTFMKYIAILLFSFVNTQYIIRKMNTNAEKYVLEKTKDIGLTVFVWNWTFEKSSNHSFKERKKFKFEDSEFWGPAGYDEYLTRTYGDYMTPPPLENQVSHHNFEAYFKE